jgi:lipopolysaccharide/colanic/teichoic acid biosynthesis glycosyltransferase
MNHKQAPTSRTLWARGGKRAFDVISASLLLILLSPVLLVTAGIIKLTSRGPLFFLQERTGKNGRIFRLIKFRTMRGDRTPDPKELVPLDHPEITGVGRFLRRFKIDELPQLAHVLSGEMSLVGPRPTLPEQVATYDDFRRQRLLVRPGITGLAQIHGNTSIPWDERILFDIAYVRRCGLLMDLGILLRTKWAILRGERRVARPFTATRYARYLTPPDGYALPHAPDA